MTAYNQVILADAFCCNIAWDGFCQGAFDDLSSACGGSGCAVTPPACVAADDAAYQQVIANDAFCCNVDWDGFCQSAFDALSTSCTGGGCVVVPPACVQADQAAYNTVIANDAFCCNNGWDALCQSAFDNISNSCDGGTCPVVPPACVAEDQTAYQQVIANDAFCCQIGWDAICQSAFDAISSNCLGVCAVTPPACVAADQAAYNQVIAADPFCCNNGWDGLCQSAFNAISFSCTGPPVVPPNDLCANAIPLTCGVTVSGSTQFATNTGAPTGCGFLNLAGAGGVWYTLTGVCGSITASTCPNTFDTQLGILTGSCGALTCIASNDDACGLGSTVTWTANPATVYYIYVTGFGTATGSFDLTTSGCQLPPAATVSSVDNCATDSFTAFVNVTATGGPATVSVTYNVNGGPSIVQVVPMGTTQLGGTFPATAQVNIISVSNGTCAATGLGSFTSNCPVDIVCGNTLEVEYCYKNNDPKTFTFISTTPTETVTVTFVSGMMAPGDVINAYSGTDDNGTPIPSLTGNFANLAGASGTSSGPALFIQIISDGSGSCVDGSPLASSWVFEAECTAGCSDPDGFATVNPNCSTIDVEVLFEGDGASTALSYSVNGGTATIVPGLTAGSTLTVGPFAIGAVVQLYLLHATDAACDKNLGSFTIPAQPNPISASATATPSIICPGGSTQLNVIAGNTTAYTVQSVPFALRTGTPSSGPTGDDVEGPFFSLPFPFTFFNTSYTQAKLNTNGYLGFAAAPTQYGTAIPNAGTPNAFIGGVKCDLIVASNLTYFTNGTAPNRVFVASWSGATHFASTGTSTFQIMLFEADMHIEVHVAQTTNTTQAKTLGIENQAGTIGYAPAGRNGTVWSVAASAPEAWAFYPSGGGPFSYSWSPAGLLNNPNIPNPIASGVPGPTTFTVSFNAFGCVRQGSVTVNTSTPIVSAAVTPVNPLICAGSTVQLTATPTGGIGPYTYLWAPGGQTTSQIMATSGPYACAITDACGNTVGSNITTVSLKAVPTATASNSGPVCAGESLTLNGSSSLGASTFAWSGPGGFSSTAEDPVIPAATPGQSGTYTLIATTNGCASAPATTAVTVNAAPSTPVTTNYSICQGFPVPAGQGLVASSGFLSSATTTVPGAPFTSNGSVPTTLNVVVPPIPVGATVTGATINLTNVNAIGFSFRSEIRVALTGAVTLGPTQISTLTSAGLITPDPVVNVPGWPAAGGSVNVVLTETFNDGGTAVDATFGGISITVTYALPVPLSWFDAPVGGTLVGTGSPFNPVAAGLVNVNTPGAYPFYVSGTFAGCTSPRTLATFTVIPLPPDPVTTNYAICDGAVVPVGEGLRATAPATVTGSQSLVFPGGNFPSEGTTPVTVSTLTVPALPPGSVITSAQLLLTNVTATLPSWMSEVRVSLSGGYTLAQTQMSTLTTGGTITPNPVINLPGYALTGGGTINLRFNESFNDPIVPDAVIAGAQIVVNYTQSATVSWWTAPVGGVQVGTGSPFDPVGAGVVNANVQGNYPFWASVSFGGCSSSNRVLANFFVGNNDLQIIFQSDGVSNTTWEVREQGTDILVQSGGGVLPNHVGYSNFFCLPNGCYYLKVMDDAGDGITDGGYILQLTNGTRIIDNRYNFSDGFLSQIANNEGWCLPLSANTLVAASCDQVGLNMGTTIQCVAIAAVTAQWNVGNQTDDGYDFWVYNPNGGYSEKRFHSHADNMGQGAPNATRATKIHLNQFDFIPWNTLLNVRVRSRVNGVNSNWGSACRIQIQPNIGSCPQTQLQPAAGPQFSCGVVRATTDFIYAMPVPAATQYEFRFRLISENQTIVRQSNTIALQLNWTGPDALMPGATYEVDVRAFKAGNWCMSGPFWGYQCQVTITTPFTGGNQNMLVETEESLGLRMFPNPNRGDQLYLTLENIAEDVSTMTVDMYDMFGKRVSAHVIPVQDGFVNTVLELNGDLAGGLYMVNITVGDVLYTERLVIQP